MTEGPGARLIADRLRTVLEGRKLERVEWPNSLVSGAALAGRRVRRVRTHGKNILVDLGDGESFRIHLLMRGAIRIHRLDEPLDVPMRLGLWTQTHRVAVVGAPTIELLATRELEKKMGQLGPGNERALRCGSVPSEPLESRGNDARGVSAGPTRRCGRREHLESGDPVGSAA